MKRAGIMHERKAELDVLHLLVGVFPVPCVERLRAALGIGHEKRQFTGADNRKAAWLIAGVDIGEIGDAVARHVVVVKRLAKLLGRIDLILDGAAGIFLDRGAPFLQCLLQRMRWWHPMRQLEFKSLVLCERAGRATDQQGGSIDTSGETEFHGFLPEGWVLVKSPTFCN